ncbi:MAG TPA: hypothetical protein VGG16_08400 [Streptosporangiaceae bacterium]
MRRAELAPSATTTRSYSAASSPASTQRVPKTIASLGRTPARAISSSARSTFTCGRPLAGSGMDATSRPEARNTIRENGSPGTRLAAMPNAGNSDVAFDHRLIARPLARNSSACSKIRTS